MPELPQARVVRNGLAAPLLPPPRKVPRALWLRLAFGGFGNQSMWSMIAFVGWLFATTSVGSQRVDPVERLVALLSISVVIFMVAVMLVGVALMIVRPKLRMLRHGLLVYAARVSSEHEGSGEDASWQYIFVYKVDGRSHQVTLDRAGREERLEDDASEAMVYLPEKPEQAMALDDLPGYPMIDADGALVAREPRVWPALLLPLLAIAGLIAAFVRSILAA